ncbi:MAG: metalloregulator ArsR/SmtB family transcription factor [Pseudomonadota bacterium]
MDKYLPQKFHALGDATRFAVVEQLLNGPASVSELAKPHDMALPAFTKHLKVLETAGLIQSRKRGRVRTCFLETEAMREIHSWIGARKALWEARMDNLASYLEEDGRS